MAWASPNVKKKSVYQLRKSVSNDNFTINAMLNVQALSDLKINLLHLSKMRHLKYNLFVHPMVIAQLTTCKCVIAMEMVKMLLWFWVIHFRIVRTSLKHFGEHSFPDCLLVRSCLHVLCFRKHFHKDENNNRITISWNVIRRCILLLQDK